MTAAATPPRGISSVEVHGFRTAIDTTLRPGALTALVGESNAGKSNLLAALRILLDPHSPGITAADVAAQGHGGTVRLAASLLPTGEVIGTWDGRAASTEHVGALPPLVYLPSELRSTTVVASRPRQGAGHHAAALLTGAVAEQSSGRYPQGATVGANALVEGLERCCTADIGGVVVLIEEPELYLRPQAQRYLYRLLHELASAGNQVVYSTHAPAFVNVARLEELALVTRNERGTLVVQPGPLPGGDAFRVMSEFDAERSELFFGDVAVLVEGRTEKLALPHVFRALGHDPDRAGISIVECGGKANIPVLAQVCHAVGIPFVVVHDRDAPAGRQPIATERELNARIAQLAGPGRVVVLEPDFEGVAGLQGHRHKPEQAWRHFADLRPADIPLGLRRAVDLAVGLTAPQRHRAR